MDSEPQFTALRKSLHIKGNNTDRVLNYYQFNGCIIKIALYMCYNFLPPYKQLIMCAQIIAHRICTSVKQISHCKLRTSTTAM